MLEFQAARRAFSARGEPPPFAANNKDPPMGDEAEPLYDKETMRIMSEAYAAADTELGTSDKVLQVTMAVAIIRAINDGERDSARLTALALSAVRTEDEITARAEPDTKPALRPGWINLTSLLT